MRPFVPLALSSLAILASFSASAKPLPCEIHPAKHTSNSALPGLAKISQADALKVALGSLKSDAKHVADGELEIERGCLIYSFDIQTPGKTAIDEIWVDAGTGKILAHKHETPKQEAAEVAKDKTVVK